MENRPVVMFRGRNVPADLRERFQNWLFEAYIPILFKVPGLEAVEQYQIIKENPLYPNLLGIYHYQNAQLLRNRHTSDDWTNVLKDMATFDRVEHFWGQNYHPLRSFANAKQSVNSDTKTVDTLVIHIEALKLTLEEYEKYNTWFVKWAYRVYIPVLMKLPGLKEYTRYQRNDEFPEPRSHNFIGKPVVTDYPVYVSVLQFENLQAFENYENSPELLSLLRIMNYEVSDNLKYEWYVQYQLVKSWRK
jgi:hypothetical protein